MQVAWLKRWFWILLVASGATMAVLLYWGAKLEHNAVDFEFCTFELPCKPSCSTILEDWKELLELARRALYLDFLFLLLYPLLFCVALLLVSRRVPPSQRKPTRFLAYLTLAAVPLDAAENMFLLRFLDTHAHADARIAGVFASIKFAILTVTVGWLIFASIRSWLRGRVPSSG